MDDGKLGGSLKNCLCFSIEGKKHEFISECLGLEGLCRASRERPVQDVTVMKSSGARSLCLGG